MPGVPRANYMPFPFQIVQSTDVVLIAYEYAEANRILYVDQPEIASQVDAWMGHSNAHWEGDALVVRVSGQMPDTWFDRAGNHHSWEMVVEERWTYDGPTTSTTRRRLPIPTPSPNPGRLAFLSTDAWNPMCNCWNSSARSFRKNSCTVNGAGKERLSAIHRNR